MVQRGGFLEKFCFEKPKANKAKMCVSQQKQCFERNNMKGLCEKTELG